MVIRRSSANYNFVLTSHESSHSSQRLRFRSRIFQFPSNARKDYRLLVYLEVKSIDRKRLARIWTAMTAS